MRFANKYVLHKLYSSTLNSVIVSSVQIRLSCPEIFKIDPRSLYVEKNWATISIISLCVKWGELREIWQQNTKRNGKGSKSLVRAKVGVSYPYRKELKVAQNEQLFRKKITRGGCDEFM